MLPLSSLVRALDALAPLELAETWDNVGLLIDPRAAGEDFPVERVLLTIDATPAVLREPALTRRSCLVAYHPPLFSPVKRLSALRDPVAFAAILREFAVYSPHTALDAAPGGINDWLIEAFGAGDVRPIVPSAAPAPAGSGRVVELAQPAPLLELVERARAHLGLTHVRLATADIHAHGAPISRVAVCAGSGGALFERFHEADLFVTGELRHHDVLSKLRAGSSVLLCEHSSSERGYLPRYRERLSAALGGAVDVIVATSDVEPLRVV